MTKTKTKGKVSMPVATVRATFADVLETVRSGTMVEVTRHGRVMALIVPALSEKRAKKASAKRAKRAA